MDVAFGHSHNLFLTLERRCDEIGNALDAVTQWFTAREKCRQHCEHCTGGGIGFGGSDAAFRSSMTEQGMLSGRGQLRPFLVGDAYCEGPCLARPGNDLNDISGFAGLRDSYDQSAPQLERGTIERIQRGCSESDGNTIEVLE